MLTVSILAALVAPGVVPGTSAADGADGRCVVVAGYVGAHGTPEQASASRMMVTYFIGRMTGRTAGAPVASIIARSAEEARTSHLNAQAEGERCQAEFRAGTSALLGVREAAGLPPGH